MIQSANGQLFFCKNCSNYHLEFGNTFFDFTEDEFQRFKKYINSIDGEYQNKVNRHTLTRRKILLPTHLKGFRFCFSAEEINELQNLLNHKKEEIEKRTHRSIKLDFLHKHYTLN